MKLDWKLIDAIFAAQGVTAPWEALPSTGQANRIFATRDAVLRVATDHPDAVPDARTESVAAPAARAAGILTPRLIAFDDTRALIDRPYSLWERVHGETFGMASLLPGRTAGVWRAVGRELARLHLRVQECPDPDGYLDRPARDLDIDEALKRLIDANRLAVEVARRIERLTDDLRHGLDAGVETRFIHDDIHPMNIMCSASGELLAILDWGDAGWGDPALDFAAIPFDMVRYALEGYEAESPGALGARPETRIAWNKLLDAVDDVWESPRPPPDVDAFRRFWRPERADR